MGKECNGKKKKVKKTEAKTVEERYVPAGEKLGKTSVSVIAAAATVAETRRGGQEVSVEGWEVGRCERDFSESSTPSAAPPPRKPWPA